MIAAASFFTAPLSAQDAPARDETPAPYMIVRSGSATIGAEETVGDLLLVDAKVELAGLVRGHVYAIDSELTVRSTAVIMKSVTTQRGSMHIEDGAVLPPEMIHPTKVSTVAIALMKSVLPFDRFSPEDGASIESLGAWHPGLGLAAKKELADPKELVIAGITRLNFVSDKVKGAFQRGYKGPRGTVLLSAVKLGDEATARALWAEIERVVPQQKIALSVKTALGDGAHWYFKRKNRHCMLWQHGAWFFAVETKLGADDATLLQERQFSEQVLTQLRKNLAHASPSARADGGVPR